MEEWIFHGDNLRVELLDFFICHLAEVDLQKVAEHDLELLRADVSAAIHDLPLVGIDVGGLDAEPMAVLAVDFRDDVLVLLVKFDVVHESDLALLQRAALDGGAALANCFALLGLIDSFLLVLDNLFVR